MRKIWFANLATAGYVLLSLKATTEGIIAFILAFAFYLGWRDYA
jgi:hypothetical protein